MLSDLNMPKLGAAVLLALLAAGPALADVKAGVDAWSRGDYTAAVREWEGPATAGDPDAMFNLGQAYRLGRGVAADLKRAEALYAQAAQAGHLQAADTYGLMLFQDGRREAALPYVRDAARRGDPRSQYLLAIAHFNGDLVEKDWVRAYALMTLASSSGLPQANPAIVEMDRHIPLEQRQQAAAMAMQLRAEADSARSRELATFDLAAQAPAPQQAAATVASVPAPRAAPPAAAPAPQVVASAPQTAASAPQVVESSPRVPRPIPTVAVSPSVSAARAAVAEASQATGTEDPGEAGASFARPAGETALAQAPVPASVATSAPEPEPEPEPAQEPASVRTAQAEPAAPAPAAAANGRWRIQLGAFSVAGNAERLWSRLSGRAELVGKQRLLLPSGRVTRLQAGGFPTRSAADAACRSLRQSGQDCLVTDR